MTVLLGSAAPTLPLARFSDSLRAPSGDEPWDVLSPTKSLQSNIVAPVACTRTTSLAGLLPPIARLSCRALLVPEFIPTMRYGAAVAHS